FSSRRRHTRFSRDWSSDVCSSDLASAGQAGNIPINIAFSEDDFRFFYKVLITIKPKGLRKLLNACHINPSCYENQIFPASSGPTRATYADQNVNESSMYSRCNSSRMSSGISTAIADNLSGVTSLRVIAW